MLGGSESLSPLESGINTWFCSFVSVGASEILSPLESGVNSCFVQLSVGGIRNSESFRIWYKYLVLFICKCWGIRNTESFRTWCK